MTLTTITSIPKSKIERARFFQSLENASEDQLSQVQALINELEPSEVIELAQDLLYASNEKLIELVYLSTPVTKNLTLKEASRLFRYASQEAANLMIEAEAHQRLTTGLIYGYAEAAGESFLPNLESSLSLDGGIVYSMPPCDAFDEAMAYHIKKTPYVDSEQIRHSFRSLQVADLPKTLEVFIGQLIADGKFQRIEAFVVESFQSGALTPSNADILRKTIGDDLVLGLCASANRYNGGCFKSASMIIQWAGESQMHSDAFLAGLKKDLSARLQPRIKYLDDFALAGADEKACPELAGFVVKNLKSILRTPKEITDHKIIVPIMALAARMGKGSQAFKLMIDGMMRRRLSGFVDDMENDSLSLVVDTMIHLLGNLSPRTEVVHDFALLLRAAEAVGLECVHKAIPGINPVFVTRFMESQKSNLSTGQILRMFPQARSLTIETDLGI